MANKLMKTDTNLIVQISTTQAIMAAGAIIAWFGLGLQFSLLLQHHPYTSMGEALVRFFSYFTILTNILVALSFTLPLLASRAVLGRFFARAAVQSGTALYITMVGVIYALLLQHLYHPQGWARLADVLVHDIVPLFYVGYWLLLASKAALRWQNAALWLLYPFAYLFYTLAHGAFTGWYPYPFINVKEFGYTRVMVNAGELTIATFMLGLLMIALARWRASSARPLPE